MQYDTPVNGFNQNSGIKLKIIDCFIFFNEIDLLKFRLKELNDVVDHFVLVESKYTFTNNKKTLFFEQNKDVFREYLPKITHLVFDKKTPNRFWRSDRKTCWMREEKQRNHLGYAIKLLKPQKQDLIIISDVDEIPDSQTLQSLVNKKFTGLANLEQDMYYYKISIKHPDKWTMPIVASYESLTAHLSKIHKLRISLSHQNNKIIIKKGGWHFSYFGGTSAIIQKIKNFSHTELNTENYTNKDNIEKAISQNLDLFERGQNVKFTNINPRDNRYLPEYIDYLK